MRKNTVILILLIVALMLSGCGEEEPTSDANAILTQVVLSAEAGLTQTAFAAPSTNTPVPPSPTEEATETPTKIVIPTSGISQTSTLDGSIVASATSGGPIQTFTPTQGAFATATSAVFIPPTATLGGGNTGSGGLPCYRAAYQGETRPYDYEEMQPGFTFNKMWKVKNTGSCPWTSQMALVLVAITKDGAASTESFGSPPIVSDAFMRFRTQTDATINTYDYDWVSIDFKAPAEEGFYSLFWKFQAPDGTIFGVDGDGALWMKVTVDQK